MMAVSSQSTEEDRYDKWAMKRIMGVTECCLYKHSMCIPIREESCKTCYREDVSRAEGASERRTV